MVSGISINKFFICIAISIRSLLKSLIFAVLVSMLILTHLGLSTVSLFIEGQGIFLNRKREVVTGVQVG